MSPGRIRRERVRVQVALDVAGAAGVAVVAPNTADVAGLLQDDEVIKSRALQLNRCREPAEAGADDRDVMMVGQCCISHGDNLRNGTSCCPWPQKRTCRSAICARAQSARCGRAGA